MSRLTTSLMLAILLSAGAALAQTVGPIHNRTPAVTAAGSQLLLNEVALNAAAASRTFNLKAGSASGYAQLLLYARFTHANNGTLTFACTNTKTWPVTNAGEDFEPTTCTVASGACTLSFAGSWTTPTLSAARKFWFPIGLLGASDVECVVTHNGAPNGSDKITVRGDLVTQ